MALTNAFNEAVSSGNTRRVRIMMKDSLLNDPSFSEFSEMVNSARNLQGLYDSHDGRELNHDKSTWTDSYMNEIMVQVVGNFSHERIDHLKKVVACLRPAPSRSQNVNCRQSRIETPRDDRQIKRGSEQQTTSNLQSNRSEYQEQKYRDQRSGSYRGVQIAGGAAVGAMIGGTVAAITSTEVVVGISVGAVIGGLAVAAATNGEH